MARPAYARVGSAFRTAIGAAGLKQGDVADALGVDPATVSKWSRGLQRIDLDYFPRIDELCGQRRGYVLRLAGYVDDDTKSTDVRSAIMADTKLPEHTRLMILDLYEAALRRTTDNEPAAAQTTGAYPVDLSDPDEAKLWALETYSEADRWKLIEGLREERRLAAGRAEGDVEPDQAAQ